MSRLFARLYGATASHLLLLLASFVAIGYCTTLAVEEPLFPLMLLWFVAAVLSHDALLLPVYALADRVLTSGGRLGPRAVNHIRVPILASGLLLLLFLPGIIRQGASTYHAATGQDQSPFLGRWLALSGLFILVSAVLYVLRWIVDRASRARVTRDT